MEGIDAIFYVHRGFTNILYYTLNQTRKYNPDIEIYLLGDEDNEFVKNMDVKHFLLSDYMESALHFETYYENMSSNPADWECFCFQRWLILRDFLEKNSNLKIETFVYLDTDVMIYTNLNEWAKRYLSEYDITVNAGYGPQYTFCSSKLLDEFAEYIISSYSKPEKLNLLRTFYSENFLQQGKIGGICDMTLLGSFVKNKKVFDTNCIVDGSTFEDTCNIDEGYEFDRWRKRKHLYKNGDNFFVREVATGNMVKLLGMHFQGMMAKFDMYKYYTGDSNLVPSKHTALIRKVRMKMSVVIWNSIIRPLGIQGKIKKLIKIKRPVA